MSCALFHKIDFQGALPTTVNDPFCYDVHPLCRVAAERVSAFIQADSALSQVLAEGKMLGVLLCSDAQGTVGFLAAYSGRLNAPREALEQGGALAAANTFFVPPIYDARRPGSRFVMGEEHLALLSSSIAEREQNAAYADMRSRAAAVREEARKEIDAWREVMQRSKAERDRLRAEGHPKKPLIAESQWQKAEMRRLRQQWRERIDEVEAPLTAYEAETEAMRQERRRYSDELQLWLFEQYRLHNARGETLPLTEVVRQSVADEALSPADAAAQLPPSATGDCCAPKLLQYAYVHGLRPLQVAEFWWGGQGAVVREARQHLSFYPACHSRCRLILPWMMHGLTVDTTKTRDGYEFVVPIVYEDQWLMVVDKPSGLLSVPNDTSAPSLVTILNGCKHPDNTLHDTPLYPVHRLDQDTSGLLLLAKSADMLSRMQVMFQQREVEKEYVAVVEGRPQGIDGPIDADGWHTLSLPLRRDIDDRPRQLVDHQYGKTSVTKWREETPMRLLLRPLTGRTHQLRIHCAHPDGLAAPIVGDHLYGRDSSAGLRRTDRLLLHAARLSFRHPITGEQLSLFSPPPF